MSALELVESKPGLIQQMASLEQQESQEQHFKNAIAKRVHDCRVSLVNLGRRFELLPLERDLQAKRQQVDTLAARLSVQVEQLVQQKGQALKAQADLLEALSHERVLERGFALVRKEGCVVVAANALKPQDVIDVQLASGNIAVTPTGRP